MSRIDSLVRRALGVARGGARVGGEVVSGALGRVRAGGAKTDMDDVTLAHKVETELFRGADAPKGSVNVNVVDGVVQLRGQVKRPADVKALEARARAVPEVRDVDNLLHLPKTPSPTRTDSPARQRKTGKSTKRTTAATRPRTGRKRTTAEPDGVKDAGEPTPDELATRREGRQPAPMGSQDQEGQSSQDGGEAPEATPPAERAAGSSTAKRGSDGA
ncbi:MAG: BON domain-containing protein [Actinomycetota bacterium]|nr:BON domain-containing protein [Actinomycetota bacterium]